MVKIKIFKGSIQEVERNVLYFLDENKTITIISTNQSATNQIMILTLIYETKKNN